MKKTVVDVKLFTNNSCYPEIKIEESRVRLIYSIPSNATPLSGYVRFNSKIESGIGEDFSIYDHREASLVKARELVEKINKGEKNIPAHEFVKVLQQPAEIFIEKKGVHLYTTSKKPVALLSEWAIGTDWPYGSPRIMSDNSMWKKELKMFYKTGHPGHPCDETITCGIHWFVVLTDESNWLTIQDIWHEIGLKDTNDRYIIRIGVGIEVV